MKRMKCYIYTRVSTSMQVDGYSLDAQKDKLRKYAEFQNMLVAVEYSDEGCHRSEKDEKDSGRRSLRAGKGKRPNSGVSGGHEPVKGF